MFNRALIKRTTTVFVQIETSWSDLLEIAITFINNTVRKCAITSVYIAIHQTQDMDYLLGKMMLDIKLLLCITILMVVLNTAGCENAISNRNDNKCSKVDECPCCLNATCDNNKICLEGCIIGYHSLRCINQCPVNCPSCTDHPLSPYNSSYWNRGYCTNCTDGFYSTYDLYQCQTPCPDGCKSCVSFNSTPENCKECKEGYYMVPAQGTSWACVRCPDTCLNCRNSMCETCRSGHFGDACEKNCSLGCDVTCKKDTGHCKCKNNFLGDKCNRCVPRKYGTDCSIDCIENCEECDRFTGNCTLCIGNFNGSSCGNCKQGKYGGSCNQICSENCKSLACDQYNGICSFGCKENFSGVFCSECVLGKYGGDCDTLCPENCLNDTCEKNTGYCEHCIGQFNGSKCKDCIEGFHGVDCKINCTSENDQQREICQRLGKSIKEDEGNQVGIIAGVSVSAVAVVTIIIGLLFIVRKRINKNWLTDTAHVYVNQQFSGGSSPNEMMQSDERNLNIRKEHEQPGVDTRAAYESLKFECDDSKIYERLSS